MKERLTLFSEGVIYICILLIALFTTITSYLYRVNIDDMSIYSDKPLMLMGICVIAVFLVGLLSSKRREDSWRAAKNSFLIVFLIDMLFCIWWIYNAQSTPTNDSRSLYEIAQQIISGDFTAVAPQNSYLSLWPFQSGLLLYMEAVLRFIPIHGVLSLSGINLVCIGLGIFSLYKIVCLWTNNAKTVFFWNFLILFCTPYLFYVNFLYNEITSMACLFFSVWMMTEYWKSEKKRYLVLAVAAAGISVLLRNNSLIFIVASVLLLFVILLQSGKKRRQIIAIISLVVLSVCASKLPQKFYEFRAGNTMGKGVTAVSYIAMGLQDTGRIPGWNNGFHSEVLIESGYDADVAADLSIESIKTSIQKFAKDPQYMISFFNQKLVPEWCDENYSCLYSTEGMYGNRSQIAHMIYGGTYTRYVLNQMNAYQSILYTGFLLYAFGQGIDWYRRCRNKSAQTTLDKKQIWSLVLAVTIIGGFLFQMMWEGGSRYTMPYMVMMTPYSAMGFQKIWDWVKNKLYTVAGRR